MRAHSMHTYACILGTLGQRRVTYGNNFCPMAPSEKTAHQKKSLRLSATPIRTSVQMKGVHTVAPSLASHRNAPGSTLSHVPCRSL